MTSADFTLVRELQQKSARLKQFKASLAPDVQSMLDSCEWSVIPNEGPNGLPLMSLRLHQRVHLGDPWLVQLAEQAERYYGPIDFAIFSWETPEPLRVLSRTILDTRWRWRHP
ncbi:MAG: hypothetical protein QNJ46_07050 [Leptolyngbyaceae cyanobacterium MO_188.B28]|nr:hypothetical protein [Leptolyngbyaceae cyanobacterium MO_188.B28]